MNSDALRNKIYQTVTGTGGNLESTKQAIASLSDTDLFIWLSEQDNSIRYHLALELDIPLQHLDNTCSTLEQIRDQLS